MNDRQRRVEIFSAGCPACEEVIEAVRGAACADCDIQVLDMHAPEIRKRAAELGIGSVPAVVIDGAPAECCAGRGVDLERLRSAGLGQPRA